MILYIKNEKRERLNEIIDFENIDIKISTELDEEISDTFLVNSENVTNLKIEKFEIVFEINNEFDVKFVVKIVVWIKKLFLSFSWLKRNFIVLIIFFA